MIEILIVIAIYTFLQKLVDYPFKKKIQQSSSAKEAIMHRKRLKKARLTFFIIFFVLYIGGSIYLNFIGDNDTNSIIQGVKAITLGLVFLYTTLFKKSKYEDLKGNVSTFTKTDYLEKNQRFALFLRGFGDDVYAKYTDIQKAEDFEDFSEYHFMKLLENRIPSCAIGMTKESDSPYGASRVYVDDETWQSVVRELMEKADEIYILANDRDSCIWEIEQSLHMLEKTTYIIDHPERYEHIRSILSSRIRLPKLPANIQEYPHQILRYRSGQFTFNCYQNDVKSYAHILDVPVPEKKRSVLRLTKKGCLWTVAIIAIFVSLLFIIRLCNDYNYYHNTYDDYALESEDTIATAPAEWTAIADDGSCSVEVPDYFQKTTSSPTDAPCLFLTNESESTVITITLQSKKELRIVEMNSLDEYVDAITQQNQALLNTSLTNQEILDNCIKTEYQGSISGSDVYCIEQVLDLDEQYVRITLLNSEEIDNDLKSMFEDVVQSFQLLESE